MASRMTGFSRGIAQSQAVRSAQVSTQALRACLPAPSSVFAPLASASRSHQAAVSVGTTVLPQLLHPGSHAIARGRPGASPAGESRPAQHGPSPGIETSSSSDRPTQKPTSARLPKTAPRTQVSVSGEGVSHRRATMGGVNGDIRDSLCAEKSLKSFNFRRFCRQSNESAATRRNLPRREEISRGAKESTATRRRTLRTNLPRRVEGFNIPRRVEGFNMPRHERIC